MLIYPLGKPATHSFYNNNRDPVFLKPHEESFPFFFMTLTPCPQYKFIVALVSFQFR